MSRLGNYWQTYKDIGMGKTSLKDAFNVGRITKGGLLGKSANAYNDGAQFEWQEPKTLGDWTPEQTSFRGNQYPSNLSSGATSAAKSSSGGSGYSQRDADKKAERDAQKEKEKREQAIRKSIGSQFDSLLSTYGSQIGELPGQQQQLLEGVGQMADTQKGTINSALENILGKLQGQRGEVATQQKQTLQDLADNTRNLFQAGDVYLGSRGAGDSSATGMYSAALTQNANKQRAGVQRDVNSMYNEIGMKEADVNTDFQAQKNEVDTWQQTQTQNIVMQYTDLKRQLEQAKANAQGMEQEALRELEVNLFNNAQQQLQQIQSQASQAMQGLQSGIESGGTLGSTGSDSIAQTGEYQVGQIVPQGEIDISSMKDIGYGKSAMMDITGNFWKVNEDGTMEYLGKSSGSGGGGW